MQIDISNLLPIGSVVLLKDANKRIMITGILQEELTEEQTTWDYIGVLYPDGYLGAEAMLLFNHESIDTVCFTGFTDEEFDSFREDLQEFLLEEEIQ